MRQLVPQKLRPFSWKYLMKVNCCLIHDGIYSVLCPVIHFWLYTFLSKYLENLLLFLVKTIEVGSCYIDISIKVVWWNKRVWIVQGKKLFRHFLNSSSINLWFFFFFFNYSCHIMGSFLYPFWMNPYFCEQYVHLKSTATLFFWLLKVPMKGDWTQYLCAKNPHMIHWLVRLLKSILSIQIGQISLSW